MKLHRRCVRVAGRSLFLVTPRAGTKLRYSVNRFHETWHIVTDPAGAKLLARLLFGLSNARRAGTLVLLHGELIARTPFAADRSPPIVLCNTQLGAPSAKVARSLKSRLACLGPSDGTVRWRSSGLDRAPDSTDEDLWSSCAMTRRQERVERRGGILCYQAPPVVLRARARSALALGSTVGMDYEYWATERGFAEGELQVFSGYRSMLATAREARREVIAEQGDFDAPERLREAIWWEAAEIVERRRVARQPRRVSSAPARRRGEASRGSHRRLRRRPRL
jgi:hypothetical protein